MAQAESGLSRRRFLGGAAAAAALARTGPAWALAPAERQLTDLMDRLWDEQRHRFPETTSAAVTRVAAGRLDPWSREARDSWVGWARSAVRRIEAIDATGLPQSAEIDRAVLLDHFGKVAALGTRYPFGASASDTGAPVAPFAVSPATGPHRSIPDLARAEDRAPAIERLAALPRALDAATAAFRHDAAIGVLPSAALLDTTLRQLTALRSAELGPGRAEALIARGLHPALERQIAALATARPTAGEASGVWALRGGEAFYADALAWHTGASLSASDAHQLGLREVALLSRELASVMARHGADAVGSRGSDPADATTAAGHDAPAIEAAGQHDIRRYGMRYAGHGQGWALFEAEMQDAAGAGPDDPVRRITRLRRQLGHAARLVTDTGLHAQRWTPAKAEAYLNATVGLGRVAAAREVERICAAPGQASAATVGLAEWRRLHALALAVSGGRCDGAALRSLLMHGPAPFAVLEGVVAARFTPHRSPRIMRSA